MRVRLSDDAEHLKSPSIGEAAGLHRIRRWEVAVKARGEAKVVLGQIERVLLRVPGGRLVREPAGARDRPPVRLPAGGNLEDEAVTLRERNVRDAGEVGADVGPVDGLLAHDPGIPRGRTPGAVHLRAVQARECVEDLAEAGHQHRRRDPSGHGVVRHADPDRGARVIDLVVAHKPDVSAGSAERGHPVVTPGKHGRAAVYQLRSGLGVVEGAVLEARRQPEPDHAVAQVGDGAELPEVRRRGGRRARQSERIQRGAHGGGGNHRATQKGSTVDNVHLIPPSFPSPWREHSAGCEGGLSGHCK